MFSILSYTEEGILWLFGWAHWLYPPWITVVKDTNCSFIEEVIEVIVSIQSLLASLLVAKDEV